MNPSPVLTVNDYYDGPRRGIAEYLGVAHIYESEFNQDSEEFGEVYALTPIDPELLALVLEDWQIWLRWSAAHERGEVDIKSHPSLPNERSRHQELQTLIGDRLMSDQKYLIRVKGTFDKQPNTPRWEGFTVIWEAI